MEWNYLKLCKPIYMWKGAGMWLSTMGRLISPLWRLADLRLYSIVNKTLLLSGLPRGIPLQYIYKEGFWMFTEVKWIHTWNWIFQWITSIQGMNNLSTERALFSSVCRKALWYMKKGNSLHIEIIWQFSWHKMMPCVPCLIPRKRGFSVVKMLVKRIL